MSRGRPKTISMKAIKESGAEINPEGIYYDPAGDRAYVKNKDGKPVYISASSAGGHREMFYAAAGIRNYITKHGKSPDSAARKQILNRAKNAEKAKALWKERYKRNAEATKRRTHKPKPELVNTKDSIKIEVPRLSDLESVAQKEQLLEKSKVPKKLKTFDRIKREALEKGIISKKSAANRVYKDRISTKKMITKLGLEIPQQFLTYYEKENAYILLVRISTSNGYKMTTLRTTDPKRIPNMFMEGDRIRRHILETGELPEINQEFRSRRRKKLKAKTVRIAQEEQNHEKSEEKNLKIKIEQQSIINDSQKEESKENLFTRFKKWIFG